MPAPVYSTNVDVAGVSATRNLLRQMEPDLLRRLDRRLNVVANRVKSVAQAKFERTGATGTAYRVRTRTRRGSFVKSIATVPGSVPRGQKWSSEPGVLASVFELANAVRDARPENVRRTQSLIETLNAKYYSPGRFLWSAWDDEGDRAQTDVEDAVREAEIEYTRRMEAVR